MYYMFKKPHDLSQLHDEILKAHPTLRGVIYVEGRDNGMIRLTLPDGVDDPGLAALVQAHDPTVLSESGKARLAYAQLLAQIKSKPELVTVQDLLKVMRLI